MSKRILLIFLLLPAALAVHGQKTTKETTKRKKKGIIYFAGGSHRIFYTPCDIQIIRGGSSPLNFTLEKVKAKDEGGLKFDTAPQFSYTVGYYFTEKKFGLEYHYDHIKYFVRQNQLVRLKGTIGSQSYNKDTTLTPDFFQMEHSDGGNYCMFNVVKWKTLAEAKDKKFNVTLLMKAGIGFGNPKTNTTIMGQHRDDKYHLSGYIAGLESGFRFLLWKYFIVTGTFKGVYAHYYDFLIANGKARQQFFSGQLNYMVGAQFPL
jgi:hypothetical protein